MEDIDIEKYYTKILCILLKYCKLFFTFKEKVLWKNITKIFDIKRYKNNFNFLNKINFFIANRYSSLFFTKIY